MANTYSVGDEVLDKFTGGIGVIESVDDQGDEPAYAVRFDDIVLSPFNEEGLEPATEPIGAPPGAA